MGRLAHGDALDFYACALGECLYSHGGARGIGGLEEGSVDFVHFCEIGDVSEENGGLNDVAEGKAGFCEDVLEVGQRAVGEFFDAAFYKFARGGVNGKLTADENHSVDFYGL